MIFSSPDPAADPYVAATVLSLQRSAYAVEARLVGVERLPPLLEDERELAAWRGRWVMAWDGVELVGAIAWTDHGGLVDIEKVMVAPAATRQGIATALVSRAVESASGRPVHVATGRDNVPGVALYAKHGFAHAGDEHVPPGLWLSRFRRG